VATAAKARWAALRTSHSGAAAARIATCSAAGAGTRRRACRAVTTVRLCYGQRGRPHGLTNSNSQHNAFCFRRDVQVPTLSAQSLPGWQRH
jgi:hypothetical protein